MPAPTTAIQKKSPLDEAFALAPAHIRRLMGNSAVAERFLIVALNQFRKVPQLATCSKESILDALVRMARLGLDPSVPNDVYLVPYKQEAALIVGYGGLRKLVLRNPEVQDVFAQVVCQNDTYRPADSPVSLPIHRLPDAFHPRGRAIGYYAAAYLRSGFWRVVSMSKAEVAAHRDRYSQGSKSTFWADNHADKEGLTNFDKMAMKTCLRQLCSPRYLSLDTDVSEALATEEALYRPAMEASVSRDVPRPSGTLPIATLSEELYGPPVLMTPTRGNRATAAQESPQSTNATQDESQEGGEAHGASWGPERPNLFEAEERAARDAGEEGAHARKEDAP